MQHNPRFLALVEAIRTQVKETDVHQIKRWQDEGRAFHLIDVREESEWARGHLPGAAYLGRGVIERDIETRYPDPQTELYLYCGGGSAPSWWQKICKKWVIAGLSVSMAVFGAGVMPDTLSNPDLFEGEGNRHMTKCRWTFTICGVKRKRRSVH